MSFAVYPESKESDLEWLGAVPSHWPLLRLRFIGSVNPSKSEVSHLDRSTEVSFFPMEAIGDDGSLSTERVRPIAEVEAGYTYFREGDVTIAKITPCFENGKGAIMRGMVERVGFGTTELIVVRPRNDRTTSEYLHWLFNSAAFRKLGEGSMYGAGGQKRVPDDFVRNFTTAIPPLEEQVAIASFLDGETSKIDTLIDEQKRLIELLKEKRQAVISHAVTKGLNPDAPMKDSGIEWLGMVPAHWEVKRLRYICDIATGSRDTVDAVPNGLFPFFVRSQEVERIDTWSKDCEGVLTAGDGVGVGKVFHHYTGKFDFHQRVYLFENFKGVIGRFFYHYLAANFYKVALEGGAKSTVDSLRRPLIANFWISVPPEPEQTEVSRYVDGLSASFHALITEAETGISLLQERRSALISAAVTGKIDVRRLVHTPHSQELEPVEA